MIFLFVMLIFFQLNLDETCFLGNEGELKIIGNTDQPRYDKNCSNLRFSITVLLVGSAAGVNGPFIFLVKGTKVNPRLRGNVLYGCRDDHDELPLGYPSMNLPPCQIQELPCLSLVLLCLEFIIGLIESACPSPSFPTLILSSAKISRPSLHMMDSSLTSMSLKA